MGKFNNKIKDFFYDATDYILIIAILLVVILIIAWRLDALFEKTGPDVDNGGGAVIEEQEDDENNDNEDSNDNNENDENTNSDETSSDQDEIQENPDTEVSSDNSSVETTNVTIPEGSLPQAIANILFEEGLIDDKISFLKTSRDMELDTEFRPGDYELNANMTVEEIVRVIARQD